MPAIKKLRKLKIGTRAWNKMAVEQLLSWAPPLIACSDCHAPVIDGYCCWRCESVNPSRLQLDVDTSTLL